MKNIGRLAGASKGGQIRAAKLRSEHIKKLADAILVFVPAGSMQPGDMEHVDVLGLMAKAELTIKEIKAIVPSAVLDRLVGVDKVSYLQPTTKSRKDKGLIRVKSKPQPSV